MFIVTTNPITHMTGIDGNVQVNRSVFVQVVVVNLSGERGGFYVRLGRL